MLLPLFIGKLKRLLRSDSKGKNYTMYLSINILSHKVKKLCRVFSIAKFVKKSLLIKKKA